MFFCFLLFFPFKTLGLGVFLLLKTLWCPSSTLIPKSLCMSEQLPQAGLAARQPSMSRRCLAVRTCKSSPDGLLLPKPGGMRGTVPAPLSRGFGHVLPSVCDRLSCHLPALPPWALVLRMKSLRSAPLGPRALPESACSCEGSG